MCRRLPAKYEALTEWQRWRGISSSLKPQVTGRIDNKYLGKTACIGNAFRKGQQLCHPHGFAVDQDFEWIFWNLRRQFFYRPLAIVKNFFFIQSALVSLKYSGTDKLTLYVVKPIWTEGNLN